MLIKLNSKLLNAYSSIKPNKHLLDQQHLLLLDATRRSSSISITLPDDEAVPVIRSKYEKLYENKYLKGQNKDEFKSKLIDYFDEIGIDYAKMVNKMNRLDHPSIKAIRCVCYCEPPKKKNCVIDLFLSPPASMQTTTTMSSYKSKSSF